MGMNFALKDRQSCKVVGVISDVQVSLISAQTMAGGRH